MARRKSQKAINDDFYRRYQLTCAFGASEPVEIDGVIIDLSCNLDSTVWRPTAALGTYSHPGALYGPRIIFPWTPPDWEAEWRAKGDAVDAPPGSLIKIATIQRAPINATFGELDLPENRERKFAYVWVFRPGGDLKMAEHPLLLIAQTATAVQIYLGNYSSAFRGMVSKLELLLGCDNLEAALDGPADGWPKPPDQLSPTYRLAILALHEATTKFDEDAYAAFGYLMARAEAEQQLLEPALREKQAEQHRAKGSEARRSSSRTKTEPLRDHAKALMVGNPSLSLTSCAKAVAAIVAADPDWDMSTDAEWIVRNIRELFDPHDFRGRIEYRPRPEWVRPI